MVKYSGIWAISGRTKRQNPWAACIYSVIGPGPGQAIGRRHGASDGYSFSGTSFSLLSLFFGRVILLL